MRTTVIIPARLASTRLPGKPLVLVGGEPMVVRTARQAQRARRIDRVVIATCAPEIAAAARRAGVEVAMTSATPRNGTERVWEAVARIGTIGGDAIINLQADEPFIDPADLDTLAAGLASGDTPWLTLRRPLASRAEWRSPHVVKLLCDDHGRALYFSRAPLPYLRAEAAAHAAAGGGLSTDATDATGAAGAADLPPPAGVWAHIGVYAFTAAALAAYARLPAHPLEVSEGLEQLRGLGAGMRLAACDARSRHPGVDTAADLQRAQACSPEPAPA